MKHQKIIPGLMALCTLTIILTVGACKKKKPLVSENNCLSVAINGRLIHESATDTYRFRTSGGGQIRFQLGGARGNRGLVIKHEDYSDFTLEFWGDLEKDNTIRTSANHENLNGKHIKDRFGNRRTIIFPDGAKITWTTESEYGALTAISIYDEAEMHRISPDCSKIIISAINADLSRRSDNEEPDGETATFEINSSGLLYYNIYTEDSIGNKVEKRVNLGGLERGKPNLINDFFDDPRIGHT